MDVSGCSQLIKIVKNGTRSTKDGKANYIYGENSLQRDGFTALVIDGKKYIDEGVPLSPENFPDPIFRRSVAAKFDTDGNAVLSAGEIQAAEYLDIYPDSSAL